MGQVLIVRLSSMGDIILTQPVIAAAQRSGHTVDLAVHPDYVALGKMLVGKGRVICSKVEFSKMYDLVFDLHGTLRARRLLRDVKTKRLIRYNKRTVGRRLLVRPKGKPTFWNAWSGLKNDEQVTQWYSEALALAGITVAEKTPTLEISEWAQKAALQTLQRFKVKKTDRIVLLAPGAKWSAKQWPLDSFIRLATWLQTTLKVVPIFVGSMKEREMCEQAVNAVGGRAVSIAGLTNIPALAAVCQQAEIMVTNDSGPLHLGLAAGAQVIAFFGPTVGAFGFAPRSHPNAVIIEKSLACRPCSLHGGETCPLGHHQCLKKISVDEVSEKILEIIEQNPRKKKKVE